MLPFEDRFTRQRQLREVGLAGQRRIEAASVATGRGAADEVAADYLRRAGVSVTSTPGVVFVNAASPAMSRARAACAFSGPAQYLAGTLAALGYLRSVLGLGDANASDAAEHGMRSSAQPRAAGGEAETS